MVYRGSVLPKKIIHQVQAQQGSASSTILFSVLYCPPPLSHVCLSARMYYTHILIHLPHTCILSDTSNPCDIPSIADTESQFTFLLQRLFLFSTAVAAEEQDGWQCSGGRLAVCVSEGWLQDYNVVTGYDYVLGRAMILWK